MASAKGTEPLKHSGRTPGGSEQSRRNSMKEGLRSRLVFPREMGERIAERTGELEDDLKPTDALELILIGEIARTSVQVERAHELMVIDAQRVLDSIVLSWDDDRRQQINNIAARLGSDCHRVAQVLEQSKHGAEFCLEHWRALGDSVAANGGLTPEQRQLCFDLSGISPLLRDNTAKVPACDDAAGLAALVARQVKRLETKLVLTLESRDKLAQAKMRLGLPVVRDKVTRGLRSDEARAAKRMKWAVETLRQLRHGIPPERLIDYETGQPVGAGAKPPPSSPPPAPPPPSETKAQRTDPPGPDGDGPLPPFSLNLSPEEREMMLVVGEHVRRLFQSGGGPPSPPGSGSPQGG